MSISFICGNFTKRYTKRSKKNTVSYFPFHNSHLIAVIRFSQVLSINQTQTTVVQIYLLKFSNPKSVKISLEMFLKMFFQFKFANFGKVIEFYLVVLCIQICGKSLFMRSTVKNIIQ